MSNSKQTTEKPASEHAILNALAANPEATAAEVAVAAGVGRSTASKMLARLASAGEARRTCVRTARSPAATASRLEGNHARVLALPMMRRRARAPLPAISRPRAPCPDRAPPRPQQSSVWRCRDGTSS